MYRKYVLTLLCLTFALSLISLGPGFTDPAHACRDYDGRRNSVVPPSCGASAAGNAGETIRDVVAATWPAALVPAAEQIMYHEGRGIVSDGYCSFGIIESTQALYGRDASGLSAYECSEYAYRIYLDVGWGAWTTYGWYTPGAQSTPITY